MELLHYLSIITLFVYTSALHLVKLFAPSSRPPNVTLVVQNKRGDPPPPPYLSSEKLRATYRRRCNESVRTKEKSSMTQGSCRTCAYTNHAESIKILSNLFVTVQICLLPWLSFMIQCSALSKFISTILHNISTTLHYCRSKHFEE